VTSVDESERRVWAAPAMAGGRPTDAIVAGTTGEVRPAVRIGDVIKRFGDVAAVDDVSLTIRRNELFTLLGPSGSGKTTLLRLIAGLLRPTQGSIWIGDKEVSSERTYRRNVGMVFQSLALFPHLDVFGNIAFPLRMRKAGRREQQERVQKALDVVRLPMLGARRIYELSGGQQQRVALARALVFEPELLLLDEPFGSLDLKLREEMQLEIVRLHRDIDVTIVNVTHDQREALTLSDRVGIMRDGRLEQVGGSEEVYTKPATAFVGRFIGNTNVLGGALVRNGSESYVRVGEELLPGLLPADSDLASGDQVHLVLHAELVQVTPRAPAARPGGWQGKITLGAFQGNAIQYEAAVPALSTSLRIEADPKHGSQRFGIGDDVCISWDARDAPIVGN
jgi:putative spermidine/putrescine transport system ATP-binding protein